MKFTGNPLSPTDVINLKRGDVYCWGSLEAPRRFDHFSENGQLVNLEGKVNFIDNARWLTKEEKAYWEKINPDLFKPLKKATNSPTKEYDMNTEPKAYLTEEPSFMDGLKADAIEVGYRVAATQVSKGTQKGILLALEKNGMGNEKIAAIKSVLESEVGEALIGILLGVALPHVPGIGNDPRAEKLAKEFRVGGGAVAGNLIVGSAMQYVLPAIQEAMKSLPELPSITEKSKSRVGASLTALPKKKETLADAIEEVEQEEVAAPKVAKA